MKKIAILGSTGSIGTQTLDVVGRNDDLQVVGIAAGSNIRMLEEQIRRFHPKLAAVGDEKKAAELRKRVADTDCTVTGGMEGLLALAAMPESETLVTAGHIIMPLAKEYGVRILPVDSEHSAIFQALNGEDPSRIHKLLITASGGPFRGKKREELTNIRVEDALKHPNWAMGQKITIDSATLVNKGLEVMEAKWLFHMDLDRIQVVVQPQSVIHSMVEFVDGGIIAQLGTPDMRHLDLSLLRSRIWTPLKGCRWLWRHPKGVVPCPRYSTLQMKRQ